MIIIGAKGYAIELADILLHNEYKDTIYFYDDINNFDNLLIEEKYKIITSEKDLLAYTNQQKFDFTLGLGNPLLRKKMHEFTIYNGKMVGDFEGLYKEFKDPFLQSKKEKGYQ
jgi:hypothetical protein